MGFAGTHPQQFELQVAQGYRGFGSQKRPGDLSVEDLRGRFDRQAFDEQLDVLEPRVEYPFRVRIGERRFQGREISDAQRVDQEDFLRCCTIAGDLNQAELLAGLAGIELRVEVKQPRSR